MEAEEKELRKRVVEMYGEKVTDDMILEALANPKKYSDGWRLLASFIHSINNYEVPRTGILLHLSGAFERIIFENMEPARALCLKRPKGRTHGLRGVKGKKFDPLRNALLDIDLSGRLARSELGRRVYNLKEKGETLEVAVEIIAEKSKYSESTVKNAYIDFLRETKGRDESNQ